MKRWLVRIAFAALFIVVGVILSLAVLITWLGTYPDDVDPKNVYYVLWKHGLNNNMNLDSALAAMSHDVWPVKQVQGLSKEQLKVRFGFIRTLDEASHIFAVATKLRRLPDKYRVEAIERTWRSYGTALGWL
jgi:hypothetical protein